MNPYYPNLFRPLTIKGVTFRNRIFAAPNMMSHMDYAGRPDDSMIWYYAEKARGGAAVVTIGDTPVDREHAATNPRSFALTPENQPMLAELVTAIHEGGALASHELNHGGITAVPEANGGGPDWEAWGPVDYVREDGVKVHGMTPQELDLVADRYAECALLLKRAGYDMALIHGGHGWLLDQFLSPLTNRRTDEFGGSLENRARFPLMVVDRVRERCGDDFLLEYRMSGAEEINGGLCKEEGVRFAQMLDGRVDLIHVSAGMDTRPAQAVRTHPTIFLPHGVNVHYAEAVKAAGVKTPVVTIGAISDPDMAEAILAGGKADVVAMTRALIADPHLPNKARAGRREDIVPCLRCLDCLGGLHAGNNLSCAANPTAGRELRCRDLIRPAPRPCKVLVAGGGPAGMMAAASAARLGHAVTLAEKRGSLGGLLTFTDRDELKEDLKRMKDHLICQVKKGQVEVLLNTAVTPEFIRDGGYDKVILAVGAEPVRPAIPGLDHPAVLHALEAHGPKGPAGGQVVVLGGGLAGCETAVSLARRGCRVTVVEMGEELAPDANWMHREGMTQAMEEAEVEVRLGLKVTRVAPGQGVWAADRAGGEGLIPAEAVVYALGMKTDREEVAALYDACPHTVCIGDCVRPRKARHAISEGLWAAVNLSHQ